MKKIIISIFVFINIINADDISTLIANIKSAPDTQKRTLINQLKLKLRNTNAKQRADSIHKLRNAQHSRNNNHNMAHKNSLHNNINRKEHITTNISSSIKQQKGKINR